MTVMPRDHEWTVADLANTRTTGCATSSSTRPARGAAPSNLHQITVGELHVRLRAASPLTAG